MPLLVALLLALALLLTGAAPAHAQGVATEGVSSFSVDAQGSTAAVVTQTGAAVVLKGGLLRASASVVVTVYDGSRSGTVLAYWYLVQDKPFVIPFEVFGGGGVRTTAGNELRFEAAATLTGFVRYAADSRTYSGIERAATCSTSISSGANVIAATAAKRIKLKSALLRSSGAGVVVFKDGSGGSTLLNVYLEANVPLVVPLDQLGGGGGVRCSTNTALHATLSGATLTAVFRYELE